MLVRKERFMEKEDIIKISNEHNGYLYPYLVAEIDIKNNPTTELKRFYFVNEAIKYIGKKTDR